MENQINVLSVDLGSNLGWANSICTIKPDKHVLVISHGTVPLDRYANASLRLSYNDIFSDHRYRMIEFERIIRDIVNMTEFDAYVTEDIFCMPGRVNAFRSLAIYMEVLERIVNTEKYRPLYKIPPRLIKKHIANYGSSDKLLVKSSIMGNCKITVNSPDLMTDHETDAIAGCWAFLQEYLSMPI